MFRTFGSPEIKYLASFFSTFVNVVRFNIIKHFHDRVADQERLEIKKVNSLI